MFNVFSFRNILDSWKKSYNRYSALIFGLTPDRSCFICLSALCLSSSFLVSVASECLPQAYSLVFGVSVPALSQHFEHPKKTALTEHVQN